MERNAYIRHDPLRSANNYRRSWTPEGTCSTNFVHEYYHKCDNPSSERLLAINPPAPMVLRNWDSDKLNSIFKTNTLQNPKPEPLHRQNVYWRSISDRLQSVLTCKPIETRTILTNFIRNRTCSRRQCIAPANLLTSRRWCNPRVCLWRWMVGRYHSTRGSEGGITSRYNFQRFDQCKLHSIHLRW